MSSFTKTYLQFGGLQARGSARYTTLFNNQIGMQNTSLPLSIRMSIPSKWEWDCHPDPNQSTDIKLKFGAEEPVGISSLSGKKMFAKIKHRKWGADGTQITDLDDWPASCGKTKLQSFQFKVLIRIITWKERDCWAPQQSYQITTSLILGAFYFYILPSLFMH